MNEIVTNSIALDVLCLDIVEAVKAHFDTRDDVEIWLDNVFESALENAVETTFDDEEQEEDDSYDPQD